MVKIIFLIFIMLSSFYLTEQTKLSHDAIIEKKNIVNNTLKLKAEENVDPNSAEEEHLLLLGIKGVKDATKSKMLYKTRDPRYVLDNQIHKKFDARTRWPQCKTIGEVHNDGNTLWSWAYVITGVFADRMCIATNGRYNQLLSTQELISCSGIKTKGAPNRGSVFDDNVWEYIKSHGLVSGGRYNTNDGCQPSKIPPISNLPKNVYKNKCKKRCYGNKMINYNHDHVKVRNYYKLSYEDIQIEVQNYGPVSVPFMLHDDFFLYKSGVYAKTKNSKFVKWQYVKLIGWGVENGVDYWLLVNSWGYEWGQNGIFKIKRGTNECYVESYVSACEPDII